MGRRHIISDILVNKLDPRKAHKTVNKSGHLFSQKSPENIESKIADPPVEEPADLPSEILITEVIDTASKMISSEKVPDLVIETVPHSIEDYIVEYSEIKDEKESVEVVPSGSTPEISVVVEKKEETKAEPKKKVRGKGFRR